MINPILTTSARQRMRSWRTPLILTVYSLFQLVFVWIYSYEAFGRDTFTLNSLARSVDGYVILVAVQFVLLVLVAPAMTAGSVSGERERQTLDLLRVTPTGSLSLLIGKLLESFGFLCLLVMSSLPMLGMILLSGAVPLLQMLAAVLFLIVTAFSILSVGMFTSVLFRRTITAMVAAYLSVFAIGVLTLLPLIYDIEKIGSIYTSVINQPPLEVIDYVPVSFIANPGLGLFSLIMDQTYLLQRNLGQYSHTLSVTSGLLPYGSFMWYNMGFMVSVSAALMAAAALRMRIQKADRPRKRRGQR
ncbi:MAG: ABC transporter permease [Clostridia bacterium]|nr:ABC transporter permease [Clostridia bacterium]